MKDYNMLIHYANFRKAVVSDVPDDICLESLALNIDKKEYILKGLPLLKNCIVSIYDSVIEYASNPSLSRLESSDYKNSGEIMKERQNALLYIRNTFLSLYCVMTGGIYDNDRTITVSKEYLKNWELPIRQKAKFQQSQLKHFEYFCRVEYLKNGEFSDWRNCDSVEFIFEEKELCYTLHHLMKSVVNTDYFQYGDFRIYSKSGRSEDIQNRFPESVRLKTLGNEKYEFYKTLRNATRDMLHIEQTGENTYQGHGFFMILCDYGEIGKHKNIYKNSRISLCITKDKLTVNLRLDFDAFGKLPEIIEQLSPNVRNGFFSLYSCESQICKFKCKRKRLAIFNETIYPKKILMPCMGAIAACNIESEADIQSIVLIYEHMKKYTVKLK